jgi:hypothetical protein
MMTPYRAAHDALFRSAAEISSATGAPEPLATMALNHVANLARMERESRDIEDMLDALVEDGGD